MKDGRLFIAQRPAGGEAAFKWEFPGGKIEHGETPEQAIIREIREELDAEISIRREIALIEHDYKSFHLTMHLFLCNLVGKDPVIKEHLAFKWITAAEVHSQDWAPADYQILDTVCSECFNWHNISL